MNPFALTKPVKPGGALSTLSDEQSQELKEWLNTGKSYREIMGLVEKDFGIILKTTSPLKQFRKKIRVAELRDRPYCPPQVPLEVWIFSIAEMVKVLRNPKTSIETRVRVSAFLLQLSRMTLDYNKLNAKTRARKAAKAEATNAGDKRENAAEEINPLDDQDKLDEVRRQVFGSAP